MARQTITYRIFVPDEEGGYRNWEELSQPEKDAFGDKVAERMGQSFNDWFSLHPEDYAKI